VTGSAASDLGLVGYPPGGSPAIDAIAGVPGQDTAFLGANADDAETDPDDAPPPVVSRVSLTSGPSFSNVTPIGAGTITKPGPLAYCPASGSASSLQDVLLVVAVDYTGGAIYRVTGATTSSPTVTQVADLPGADTGVGLPALKADCASGAVIAASGGAGAGLLESSDGGQTFTDMPVDDPGGGAATIRALALAAGSPPTILVGDSAGFIQSSTNGGQTWTVVNDPSTGVNLGATANNDGGIWDIEAPPAAPSAGSSRSDGGRIASRAAATSAADLVAGPGEFIGSLKPALPTPRIVAFKLTNTRFRLGSGPTAMVARAGKSKHRGAKRGSAFVFTLSAPSTTAILFSRSSPGRLVRGKCVAERKANAGKRHCTIEKLVELPAAGRVVGGKCVSRTSGNARRRRCTIYHLAVIVRASHAGVNRVAFSGRVGRTALAAGTYVATLVARIGNGPDSQPRTARFTIVGG